MRKKTKKKKEKKSKTNVTKPSTALRCPWRQCLDILHTFPNTRACRGFVHNRIKYRSHARCHSSIKNYHECHF